MASRTFIRRTIRWSAWEGFEDGLEHVDIRPEGTGIVASGIIVGSDEGFDYRKEEVTKPARVYVARVLPGGKARLAIRGFDVHFDGTTEP